MINIQTESLIPFRKVPAWTKEHLGNRVHPTTIHRWRLRGARGVKLETLLAGGTRYTSVEALNRFFAGTTAAADGETYVVESDVIDDEAVQDAEENLTSEGI